MKISTKAEYACLAVLALARSRPQEPPVRLRAIAEIYGIPERYLVQVLLQLKGAGLVHSTRGALGGYRLAQPPEEISVGAILRAIDGPEEPSRCSQSPASAALAGVWDDVRAAEKRVLDQTTIADLAVRITPEEWVI